MAQFLSNYEQFGAELSGPDWYILLSYIQSLVGLEAFSIALENGDVTRAGFLEALRSFENFDAEQLLPEPFSLTRLPYQGTTRARVLDPVFDGRTWRVISDYATPETLEPASN